MGKENTLGQPTTSSKDSVADQPVSEAVAEIRALRESTMAEIRAGVSVHDSFRDDARKEAGKLRAAREATKSVDSSGFVPYTKAYAKGRGRAGHRR